MVSGSTGVFLGILLNIIGSFLAAGGLIIQKTTHNSDNEAEEEEKTSMFCRWRWWAGLGSIVSAGLLEAWSYTFAPLSVIAPLSGFTVVVNTGMAVLFLGETTSYKEVSFMSLIIIGISLTSAFGSREDKDYTSDQFSHMFQGCQYEDSNLGPLTTTVNGTTRGDNIAYYNDDCPWGIMFGYYVGILGVFVFSTVVIKCFKNLPRLNAFGYANFAAICGGQQNMFLKVSVELLSTTFSGDGNQFKYGRTYIFVIMVGILAFAQITMLNAGLSRHEAISYIPVYQAMLVVWGSTAGGVYFYEFAKFDALAGSMFALGILFIAGGLFALTVLVVKAPTVVKEGEEDAYWSESEDAISPSHSKPRSGSSVNMEINATAVVGAVPLESASELGDGATVADTDEQAKVIETAMQARI